MFFNYFAKFLKTSSNNANTSSTMSSNNANKSSTMSSNNANTSSSSSSNVHHRSHSTSPPRNNERIERIEWTDEETLALIEQRR